MKLIREREGARRDSRKAGKSRHVSPFQGESKLGDKGVDQISGWSLSGT